MPHISEWRTTQLQVERDWLSIRDGRPRQVVGLRHATYPAEAECADLSDNDELRRLAERYLSKVAMEFKLHPRMWGARTDSDAMQPHMRPAELQIRFQPVGADPRMSFFIDRQGGMNNGLLDQSLIMLFSVVTSDGATMLGSGAGVRIHAWVRRSGDQCTIGITSVMVTRDLAFHIALLGRAAPWLVDQFKSRSSLRAFAADLKRASAQAQGIDESRLSLDGMRIVLDGEVDVQTFHSAMLPSAHGNPHGTGQTALWQIEPDLYRQIRIESHPLVAHATASAELFTPGASANRKARLVEPASQCLPRSVDAGRPSRGPRVLEDFRGTVEIETWKNKPPLIDPDQYFVVFQSKLADRRADESIPHSQDLADLPTARSNGFAAVSAFRQSAELFACIRDFGLLRSDFFKFAARPLQVRYRSAIHPGPGKDGRIVNAQVAFQAPECDFNAKWDPAAVRPLQLRFALADAVRSSSSREPLGLATDPRWSWHEFSHVLLAGATGKLELPFVHSLGDALAAVACDPGSELAGDDIRPGLRGATYPWVRINRRHDRSVRHGWSWSGAYHRAEQFDQANRNCRHKGYDSEQILSSTLFTLYRSLGGDTCLADGKPDQVARRSASDYVVYLIMRAIASLGWNGAVPIELAEQLAIVLMDADVVTMPAASGPLEGRAGGCALKVIRWAFEAQGMYAKVAASVIHDAPGKPPEVDVYLDDGRDDSRGPSPRGGYMPVSLDWHSDRPKWHATGDDVNETGSIVVLAPNGSSANTVVRIGVSNRGSKTAGLLRVQVWYVEWVAKQAVPAWQPDGQGGAKGWVQATIIGTLPAQVGPGATVTCEFAADLKGNVRYLILAKVDAAGDLCILDPDTGLPSALKGASLAQLVSGDNNLGLRVYYRRT